MRTLPPGLRGTYAGMAAAPTMGKSLILADLKFELEERPKIGQVLEINAAVVENPALVNTEPHAGGWFFKIKLSAPAEVSGLMTPADYLKQIGG